MTREEFIQKCALLGLGAALAPSILASCKKDEELIQVNFSGKVLIIGAGAAGLMAGHLLHQYNIDFEIIEASSIFGGRVKRTTTFTDFPIDLGGEWVHTSPDVFSKLIRNENTQGSIDLVPYNPSEIKFWNNGSLLPLNVGGNIYGESKFKSETWYGFFDKYIVPDISSKIVYNSPITSIDYNGSTVTVTDSNSNTYQGNKVLVTVPTTILQSNMINFSPALPQAKLSAIDNGDMPDGIKVFMKFSERFYPDLLIYKNSEITDLTNCLYYDAAFKKNSNENIMGLFCVGPNAPQYTNIPTDQELIEYILAQLDEVFDGKASQSYLSHVTQNWSAEPYILGSYTSFSDSNSVTALRENINQKVYFSGEAIADESSTVHGAGLHAMEVIEGILTGG